MTGSLHPDTHSPAGEQESFEGKRFAIGLVIEPELLPLGDAVNLPFALLEASANVPVMPVSDSCREYPLSLPQQTAYSDGA